MSHQDWTSRYILHPFPAVSMSLLHTNNKISCHGCLLLSLPVVLTVSSVYDPTCARVVLMMTMHEPKKTANRWRRRRGRPREELCAARGDRHVHAMVPWTARDGRGDAFAIIRQETAAVRVPPLSTTNPPPTPFQADCCVVEIISSAMLAAIEGLPNNWPFSVCDKLELLKTALTRPLPEFVCSWVSRHRVFCLVHSFLHFTRLDAGNCGNRQEDHT